MSDTSPPLLAARLQRQFPQLSPKQQAVARVLVADPTFVAFASVAELAERADVDPATVVRTCQSLGYRGWTELQDVVREDVSRRPTFADRVQELETGNSHLVDRVFAAAMQNVTETLEGLDLGAFQAAAHALGQADGVLVAAAGVSHGPGQFLTSSLQLLGRRAVLITGAADAGPALSSLRPGDAVLAVSVWRYLRTTIQVLERAKAVGATTITVTDSLVSAAATVADHVLVARTVTAGPRLGLAGIMTLMDALITQVAAEDPEAAAAAAARADQLYYDGHVLGDAVGPDGQTHRFQVPREGER
jgi:RpiR family transcriptional regulator, carbohydrate utilization regulator